MAALLTGSLDREVAMRRNNMWTTIVLCGIATTSAWAAGDCEQRPSRASDAYWSIERCGCGIEAVSRAASDYERWTAACDEWKRKNAFTSKP